MLNHQASVINICTIVLVIAVAVVDLRTRRIPNLLTLSAALAGMTVNTIISGAAGLWSAAAGLGIGLAVFLPFYLTRGFGGGDVKAMAAIGSFLGPKGVLVAAAGALMAGAVGAILVLLATGAHRQIREITQRWLMHFLVLGATGRAAANQLTPEPAGGVASRRFPYGLAIACGTIASLIGSWVS